jgi:hypothetical protein
MRSVENSSSFAFLKKFPSPSQLYVAHKDRKVGDTFLAECGPYFVFYDNLARLLRPKEEPIDTHERQPTATHEPATANIESRHSRAERSVATLPDSYVTGSGLGLSSSQEQSPFSDCADTSYAPQDSADIVLPEIITQLTAVSFLSKLCRDLSNILEFTSEQVSYKVNTGRGIFVDIDDGGMDESIRKDLEPARCRRWMALECKPRLGVGEEGEIKILAQHVAEMLGLIAGRIERADRAGTLDPNYSNINKWCVSKLPQ